MGTAQSLEARERRVVELCQRFVRIESLSGREEKMAGAVEAAMAELGYDEIDRDECGSVVGTIRGTSEGRTVLFDAHMDTVDMGDPQRWTREPLGGDLADGRLWGRGATDIKGSLAAVLVAAGSLRREELAGTIRISASIAEEAMEGMALTQVLRRHPAECVVICEPTGLRLGLGHKGRASLVVEAEGKAAHTSNPERGINAVYRLVEAITALRALRPPTDEVLGPGIMELVEVCSEPFPGSSMVPYRALARFDRRIVRGETREGVLAELQQALHGHAGVTARYHRNELRCYTGRLASEEVFHPCWVIPEDADLVRAARAALTSAGQDAKIYHAPYCTNGSASAGELGVPSLVYGAGEIADAHVVDEGLDLQQLASVAQGYAALALALTRSA